MSRLHAQRMFSNLNYTFISGWHKQQLLKLACASVLRTPFYLTTDADLFYLAPVSALDLLEQGNCSDAGAICRGGVGYRARNELQVRQAAATPD